MEELITTASITILFFDGNSEILDARLKNLDLESVLICVQSTQSSKICLPKNLFEICSNIFELCVDSTQISTDSKSRFLSLASKISEFPSKNKTVMDAVVQYL